MIEFSCGRCGKGFKVADNLAGKSGKCKQCGEPVRIPGLAVAKEEDFPAIIVDEEDDPRPSGARGPVKFCRHCGGSIATLAEICPRCGVRQHAAPAATGGKSKVVAALFAFFLGGIGIHKFYLGRIGWGFVYLLFFWTFIPAIVALIDGIILVSMSESDFARKYAEK